MKSLRVLLAVLAVTTVVGLAACAPASTPVIEPVTVSANDLQGKTVELEVGQVLNINTGDLAVDSYTATIADDSIVEFVQGDASGSAITNPGFTGLKPGQTAVTMKNAQGGIQPLEFTVKVNG